MLQTTASKVAGSQTIYTWDMHGSSGRVPMLAQGVVLSPAACFYYTKDIHALPLCGRLRARSLGLYSLQDIHDLKYVGQVVEWVCDIVGVVWQDPQCSSV